ncbi:Voltage-dependent calcium channel subunit alpha-2/delta-3 [Armadillidium nasatum]|uniref:Voltage-dependent calcium channel subunit alpha-2/delta-3 n=1 Tax=Armadillidium nasatum TaxID=96803 RepID=A0A5N5SVK5_9CRUS|nr:Voltage-dependent calcium channel subunit alpha-2/delta-3 [Armadillidium nasatum]
MKDNVHFNASDYFSSGNWSLHPEWVYCEYKYDQGVERTPEELMLHFLAKAQMPGWKWRSTRTRPPPDSTQSKGHQGQYDETDYYCDKDLIQNLLFDAQATDVYNKTKQKESFTDDKNHGKHKNFGISSVFVSTRSGLSRWLDIGDDLNYSEDNPHFMKMHNRAIDEVWYKRAVDYYKEDTEAYVYSVPFDAATRDPSQVYVTASRAIFIRQNKFQQAPAAVVGVNIKLDKFVEFFKNETYACRQYSQRHSVCQKEMTCKSEFLDCYLLDDSGFVVASEKMHEIGKFFGEIEGTIMESLVQSDVYNRIKIYDYQAVCLDPVNEGSFASILLTPLEMLKWTTKWVVGNMMWILVKTQLYHLWDPNEAWAYSSYGGDKGTNYQDYDHPPPVQPSDFGTIVTDEEINIEAKNTSLNTTIDSIPPDFEELEITNDYEIVELNETSIEIINNTIYNSTKYNKNETIEFEENYEEIPFEDYDINNEDAWNPPIEEGEEEFPRLQLAFINKTEPRPCDKEVNLYKLNNSKLKETKSDKFKPVKGKLSNCHSNGCGSFYNICIFV